MSGRGKLCWASAHVLVPAQPDDERGWLRRVEYLAGAVAGVEMHDGDNFWDDCRWTTAERGRCTSMAKLQRIILCDPPLEIALWDAKDEAADVAGGCGACELGDPILVTHQRILAHLEKRAERILAAEKRREGDKLPRGGQRTR